MTTKEDEILNVFFQGFAFLLQKCCVVVCFWLHESRDTDTAAVGTPEDFERKQGNRQIVFYCGRGWLQKKEKKAKLGQQP